MIKAAALLVLCAKLALSQFVVSGALEAPVKSPPQFSLGVGVGYELDAYADNVVVGQYNASIYRPTALLGIQHTLTSLLKDTDLVGDMRAGAGCSIKCGFATQFGAAIRVDIGADMFAYYGLHMTKIYGERMYPSLYIGISKTFGR